jgi:hypothetical protein
VGARPREDLYCFVCNPNMIDDAPLDGEGRQASRPPLLGKHVQACICVSVAGLTYTTLAVVEEKSLALGQKLCWNAFSCGHWSRLRILQPKDIIDGHGPTPGAHNELGIMQ